MIKVLTAALLASVMAVPAQAADFVVYTFNVTGVGIYHANTSDGQGLHITNPNNSGQFVYYLPVGQFASNTGTNVIGPPVSSYSQNANVPLISDRTSITVTGSTLSFSDTYDASYLGGPRQIANVSACGLFAGVFFVPIASFTVDPACSTATLESSGPLAGSGLGGFYYSFNGTVSSIDVREGFGAPPAIGLTVVPTIPEPSTWALMLLGFAGIGAALRRSRRRVMVALG